APVDGQRQLRPPADAQAQAHGGQLPHPPQPPPQPPPHPPPPPQPLLSPPPPQPPDEPLAVLASTRRGSRATASGRRMGAASTPTPHRLTARATSSGFCGPRSSEARVVRRAACRSRSLFSSRRPAEVARGTRRAAHAQTMAP